MFCVAQITFPPRDTSEEIYVRFLVMFIEKCGTVRPHQLLIRQRGFRCRKPLNRSAVLKIVHGSCDNFLSCMFGRLKHWCML